MDFIKHKQENNKNLASLNEIEERLKSQKPKYKNYQRAKTHGSKNQTDTNSAIEFFYHSLVEKVKELHATLPNKEDRVVILLDLTKDPVNLSGIHCLVTPSFFVHLECDYYNNYKVEYQFFKCQFEGQIQELINKLSLRSYSTQITTQPEYPAFFKRCLQVNPERFIHLL
ncbi:hypothetical protein VRU48_08095 [Pedobacter sp. KR3-3]|uniref:Uncharacterized protein n=1 Tax=Pedobacter albus TaxID=3113905 RepID=A0ABU7I6R3_9SPHI|nr:hypothetical protein [Pedobacter sp. KR3-3]MEE1945064.1 hypothetical protein [Pedobacter sp. KR3-3]